MKKIIIISDFILSEISGGAEHYVQVLFDKLSKKYDCQLIKSADIQLNTVSENKDSFWIISNFKLLSEFVKNEIIQKT